MWDDFTQADRTLHRTSGGLGLGLVLVKGLTELHGGEVHAESEGPGRGTSVSVSLPLARGKGDGEGQGRQGEEAGSLPVSSPSPPPLARRVLIVEDNRDTVESLRDLLEYYGCTVQIALSGTEGLEKAQEFLPEVILCDLGLPGIDGFELARALRRIPELQEALLVAISGYGGGEMKARAHHAGFDAHLVKPIDFAELQRLLRQQ
jgi:two-component system CheB/CheR fusion protein